jgi:flagellar hook-basal body complex protein FliE
MTVPSIAANAYSMLQKISPNSPQNSLVKNALAQKEEDSSFGAMLEGAIEKFVAQGHASDMKARELVAGKGDLIDVVTAVADSEVAVQTLVSVRDKMIAAYEDIMKMPI